MAQDDEHRLIAARKSIKRARQYVKHIKLPDESQRSIDIIHSNLKSAEQSLGQIIGKMKDETHTVTVRRVG